MLDVSEVGVPSYVVSIVRWGLDFFEIMAGSILIR